MKCNSRAAYFDQRLPTTSVLRLMDDQLIIILRAWGSSDYSLKFTDEVQHYLSSTQADLEVTTPFDYRENLSSLANRTRVSILLAHDLFYKNENKNEYLVGFEATILFKSKNELAWSSVGRFAIDKITDQNFVTYLKNGSDLDTEILLPVQLIGVEREIDISSGSMFVNSDTKIAISSIYKCDLQASDSKNSQDLIDISLGHGAYWYTVITQE